MRSARVLPTLERSLLHGARGILEGMGRLAMGVYGGVHAVRSERGPVDRERVHRILLIRLDLLGDVVFSLPTLAALKDVFPEARLDVLVLPYTAPIVARFPGAGRIHSLDVNRFRRPSGLRDLPSLVSLVARLQGQRYDLAIGLSGTTGGLFAALSGARWRVGYAEEAFWGCYNRPVAGRRYRYPKHEVEYCLDLVRALGFDAASTAPRLPVPPESGANGGDRSSVVIVPGASNGSAKRWPAEYWARLGDRLSAERSLEIVISGAASERDLAAAVARGMTQPCSNLAGETSVEGLMSLLARADVVIAGDTGSLHLAAALGRPVVGIFGPTDPVNTGPQQACGSVVRLGLSCSPCYDLRSPADCKLPDRSVACMWGLSPDRVYAEVCSVLDRAAAHG